MSRMRVVVKRVIPEVAALKKAEKERSTIEQRAVERQRKIAQMRSQFYSSSKTEKSASKPASETTVSATNLNKQQAPSKTRAPSSKNTQDRLAAAMQAKERQQQDYLAAERKRKAEDDARRKEKNLRRQKEAEDRRRADAVAKKEQAEKRRMELAAKEKAMLAQMAARKAEIAERQRIFEEKAAKQKAAKAARLQEQARLEMERKQKLQELEQQRLRKQQEAEEARRRQQREAEEARRKQQQEADDAAAAALLAQAALDESEASKSAASFRTQTPNPDSYDLSGLVSDASSDEEDNPREVVPKWAQGAALKNQIYNQFIFTPDEKEVRRMFPTPEQPMLHDIFQVKEGRKKKTFRPRTSSAHWEPSPSRGLREI